MKITIGDNIRRLRRQMDLTQEELADKLCVSLKVVSRWETGATYPPLDLIPAMSALFGVTADELIGVTKAEELNAPEEYYNKLNSTTDAKERFELLKVAHRDYPNDYNIFAFLCEETREIEQKRKYAEELLERCQNPIIRWGVVSDLIQYETDEEKLNDYLDRYTTGEDMSRNRMLLRRYEYRKEYSKYEPLKQLLSFHDLTNNVFSYLTPKSPQGRSVETELRSAKMRLKIINVLCEMDDKNLVTGDGQSDLWVENRWHWGVRYCCYLSGSGRTDEALNVLEDLTDYIERFLSFKDGTVLEFRSPAFSALEGKLTSYYSRQWEAGEDYLKEKIIRISITAKSGVKLDIPYNVHFCCNIDFYPLTIDRGWEWFDPIRNTDRFKACLERLKKFANETIEEKQ